MENNFVNRNDTNDDDWRFMDKRLSFRLQCHREILSTINCIYEKLYWKDEKEEKEVGMDHFLKKHLSFRLQWFWHSRLSSRLPHKRTRVRIQPSIICNDY